MKNGPKLPNSAPAEIKGKPSTDFTRGRVSDEVLQKILFLLNLQ